MPRRPAQLPDEHGHYQCGRCERWLPDDGFYFLQTGPRAGTRMFPCRECSRRARPKYKPASYAKRRRLLAALKDKPCAMCAGRFHPAAMDFHHRDPASKDPDFNGHASTWSVKRLLKEIEKCDVVCANCHRTFHAEQRARKRGD